ncbi:MAG: DIM6/NTAB family protein [Idiomarinaceae bacterium HL-53]|nr:MAG: DIM6/NTAB family protein [Idiomarinaceae bacterium HL-53]CUS48964.1 NADH-FMN oxidoreductase RutF, flavin reductase (DIM6/NTAB) family [Idiomarinaceae bacterium HL-53]
MIIDFSKYSSNQRYHAMTQTIIPRPIAWVLTQHVAGHFNLAPFSYFTAVSSDPALLMFSVGDKAPGEPKDTKYNVEQNPYFVVHIPSTSAAHGVTESARTLPALESELDESGLQLVAFDGFPIPRIESAPIAFGCKLHSLQPIEGSPQTLVFGEIQQVFVHDRFATIDISERDGQQVERLNIDAAGVDPLARLGAAYFAGLSKPFKLQRPD